MAAWWVFLVANYALVCSALSGLSLGSHSSDVAVQRELLRKWKATARPDVFENWRLDEDADPCTEQRNGVACSRIKCVIQFKVSSRFISNELKFFRHRALLQVAPVVTPVIPPVSPPVTAPAIPPPAPTPVRVPAPPTPVRTYLMWVGIGACCLVLTAVAAFCLRRKFGQHKIRGAQRLPPLPRYS